MLCQRLHVHVLHLCNVDSTHEQILSAGLLRITVLYKSVLILLIVAPKGEATRLSNRADRD